MKLFLAGVVLAVVIALPAHAQDPGRAEVTPAERHDVLPSLRNVVPQKDGYGRWHFRAEHMIPLPVTPPGQTDGAVQSAAARARSAPTVQTGVDGVGKGFAGPNGSFTVQYAPPDTVGAIGATQYVQIVNSGLAVFDKATKNVVYGPVPTNTPWVGFGGACEADNDGDAVVVYDKAADRWIISQFAVAAKPYFQCVAVSQTSDATGAYNRYAFLYGKVFPDYPKMGVWPDGYYETFNMESASTAWPRRLTTSPSAAPISATRLRTRPVLTGTTPIRRQMVRRSRISTRFRGTIRVRASSSLRSKGLRRPGARPVSATPPAARTS